MIDRPSIAATDTPVLATPDQIEAEKILLNLLKDPALKKVQAQIKADLAATPRGQAGAGAARLDEAIAQWTNSAIFGELIDQRTQPAFLWATDDTPRTWLGHTIGGVGTSGDNPDAVYRMAGLDGAGRYEVLGQFDVKRRPAQLVMEIDRGSLARPAEAMDTKHADLVRTVALFTDRDLTIAPDGSFRITIGGEGGGPNHFPTEPGPLMLGTRDMLSDWNQRPCRLTLRRLDKTGAEPFDVAGIRERLLKDLPDYVKFWANFPNIWFGGLKSNAISPANARDGGWGFNAAMSFDLQDDDAIVITAGRGDAAYTGFQIIDPWMIAPDAARYQVSLNGGQVKPNTDGSITYVVARKDPGIANWLDTAGLHQGFGILRWQGVPKGATKEGLIHDFKVVKVADLAKMPDLARITPAQRKTQLAARTRGYRNRTL